MVQVLSDGIIITHPKITTLPFLRSHFMSCYYHQRLQYWLEAILHLLYKYINVLCMYMYSQTFGGVWYCRVSSAPYGMVSAGGPSFCFLDLGFPGMEYCECWGPVGSESAGWGKYTGTSRGNTSAKFGKQQKY